MLIKSLDSWMLRMSQNPEHRDSGDAQFELIGVTLTTDDGVSGMGYTWTADGGGHAVKALIDTVMTPRAVGRRLDERQAIWEDLWWTTHRLGRGVNMMAIAAIDIALWDALARAHETPLARLLGQAHDWLPTYSSGRASPRLTVDQLVANSVDAVEQGFRAVKLRVGLDPQADIGRVEAVREAVGPDIRIMCDANERLDLATALWLGGRLADLDVFWFEEPIPADFVAGHQRLAEALPMAVAVGEHLFSLWEFTAYVDRSAAGILQPDVCMVGGITEFLRIADLALAHGLPVAPHFVPELHVHLAAALPKPLYVESFPMIHELLKTPLVVEDGHVQVPTEPGHGVAFHDWVWEKYRVA